MKPWAKKFQGAPFLWRAAADVDVAAVTSGFSFDKGPCSYVRLVRLLPLEDENSCRCDVGFIISCSKEIASKLSRKKQIINFRVVFLFG